MKEKFSWQFKAVAIFGFLGASMALISLGLINKTNNILLTTPLAIGMAMMVTSIYFVMNTDKVPIFKE